MLVVFAVARRCSFVAAGRVLMRCVVLYVMSVVVCRLLYDSCVLLVVCGCLMRFVFCLLA